MSQVPEITYDVGVDDAEVLEYVLYGLDGETVGSGDQLEHICGLSITVE